MALAGMTVFVTGCVAPFSDLQSAKFPEFNPSAKVMIPFQSDELDTL